MRNPVPRPRASLVCLAALAAVVATCSAAAAPGPTAGSGARKVVAGKTPHAVTPKAKKGPTRIRRRAAVRLDKTAPTQAEQPTSRLDDAVHGHDQLACVEGSRRRRRLHPLSQRSARRFQRPAQLHLCVARLRHELSVRCPGVRRGRESLDARSDRRRDDRVSRHTAPDSARVSLAGRGHVLQRHARMGRGERRSRCHRVRGPQ